MEGRYDLTGHSESYKSPICAGSGRDLSQLRLKSLEGAGMLLTMEEQKYYFSYKNIGGTRWRSWLRHCATRRKVAGSIPDGIVGFFSFT